jgi:hypothetical protein
MQQQCTLEVTLSGRTRLPAKKICRLLWVGGGKAKRVAASEFGPERAAAINDRQPSLHFNEDPGHSATTTTTTTTATQQNN